jgi:hypothetical protein
MRTLGVDARFTLPEPLQDAPGSTISPEAVPQHPPAYGEAPAVQSPIANRSAIPRSSDPTAPAELERWRQVLKEYDNRGKPQPEQISPNEAAYRRFTGQAGTWVDIEQKARQEMARRRALQARYAGTPGQEFDF